MSEPYLLSAHVHICVAGGQVVLLDLARDKYMAVSPPHRLAGWVQGWPVAGAVESADAAMAGASAAVAAAPQDAVLLKMLAAGMLVTDHRSGKSAVPVQSARPEMALLAPDLNSRPRASGTHLWRLALAHARARASLKARSIESVVEHVARRRARALEHRRAADTAASEQGEPGALAELVAAFVHLRPLFYTARGACLLDSLVLLTFLAGYRFFPQWVFGVQADPFYAHCWVQQQGVVLTDSPGFVRSFTPIMVV